MITDYQLLKFQVEALFELIKGLIQDTDGIEPEEVSAISLLIFLKFPYICYKIYSTLTEL